MAEIDVDESPPLATRRILVVGATGGIGGAIVASLGAGGASMIIAGRDAAVLDERRQAWVGRGVDIAGAVVCDLSDAASIDGSFADLDIDSVVFAAGVGASGRPLRDSLAGEIEATITANTLGPLLVLRAILPGLVAKPHADVVCIGSTVGQHSSNSSLYGASKAASHMMMSNLRLELEGESVRVIEIAPGRVRTELFRRARGEEGAADVLRHGDDFLDPQDVAACVRFALELPRRAQVNLLEVMPSKQILGGSRMT